MSIESIQSQYPNAIWFDSNHGGTNAGTLTNPYTSMATAIGAITSNANVIAVLNGSHNVPQSDLGGSTTSSTISLGGTADTLHLVGESTEAILNTTGEYMGGIINLQGASYDLIIETLKITHDKASSSGHMGLIMGSQAITVDKCVIEISANTYGSSTFRGMFAAEGVNSASGLDNILTVTNSVIQVGSSGTYGMLVGGHFQYWDAATITGNTIVKVGSAGTRLYSHTYTSLSPSIFKNNIFVGTSGTEVLYHTPATNSNNCFSNTGISSGGTDNIFVDPQFVDSANGDYRLRPSSPCINAGTAS